MNTQTYSQTEKIKHGLYLFSIICLLLLSAVVFDLAVFDTTQMDFLKSVTGESALALIVISGALILVPCILLIYKLLDRLSKKQQFLLTGGLSVLCIALQFFLLFHLRPILRYDHLNVFDEALAVFRTGEISLINKEGYFGEYPFNIPITLFHYFVLRVFKLLGISEANYMLALQCVYLIGIDLSVFFSYRILQILHSQKAASLFALICFINPVLYFCAAGCYTTTLFLPLIMGNLLLLVCFFKEQRLRRKLLCGFLLGITLVFGIRIRVTLLITVIATVGYLVIHTGNPYTVIGSAKRGLLMSGTVFLGAALCLSGCFGLEKKYVRGDYTDTQLPPVYYLMFAANPETRGSYNIDDHSMILNYETLEEKKEAAREILGQRLSAYGVDGILDLAEYKLGHTWSDGTDDYADFIHTCRNYGKLHTYTGGSRGDLFALYCHIYWVSMLVLLLISVIALLKKRCDTPFYIIALNLLGAMLFHILWESYYIYSLGFSMLMLLLAADGADVLADIPKGKYKITFPACAVSGIALLLIGTAPYLDRFLNSEFSSYEYAVVQDMNAGRHKVLQVGESITQTFRTDRPFTQIGCKVHNPAGEANTSSYTLELLDEQENVLVRQQLPGSAAYSNDYCYLQTGPVIPQKMTEYRFRITCDSADPENYVIFLTYNTQNLDIYPDGVLEGTDIDRSADLNFIVFENKKGTFFH
ncbi:MAG: hypothetical protein ACI4DV_05820 [Lachnospiraceae bacterium]